MNMSEIDSIFNENKICDGFSMCLATGLVLKNYSIPSKLKDTIEDIMAEAFILGHRVGLENKSKGYL